MEHNNQQSKKTFFPHRTKLLFFAAFLLILGAIALMLPKKKDFSYVDASYLAMDEHGWPWWLELKGTGEFYLSNLISSTLAVQGNCSYELQGDSLVLRYDTLDATLYFTVDGGNLIFQDDLSQYEAKSLAGWSPSALFGDGTVFVHNEGMGKQE